MVPLIHGHSTQFEYPREVVLAVSSEYEEDVFLRAVEAAGRRASSMEN
jgi:hypothetical protein